MSKACLLVLLGLLTGCSRGTDKAGQTKEADSSGTEAREEKWERVAYKIGKEDYVRFALKESRKDPSQEAQSATRILLGCGYLPALVVDVPSSVNGNVKIAFDEATLAAQKWIWFPQDHFLGPPGGHTGEKKLLAQMMKSRILRLEFTPRNGTPRLATFNMLDVKDLVNQEPVCDFWLPPAR